ncbi:MAG: histidine kinase [Bacteroidales bacterium]|jgi:hypothetical protein
MWTIENKSARRRLRNFVLGLGVIIIVPVFVNFLFGDFRLFNSFVQFVDEISYGFSIGALFWLGNWAIGSSVGRMFNWRKNPSRANLISLLTFILYGILVSLTVPWFFAVNQWKVPAERLLNTIVINGFIAISVDMIIISIFYSNYIVHYWGKSIKNEEELKRENLIARYEALKNQVNPHFLFNTLNTLTGVVEQNPEKASEFIRKLSDIYRYVLEQKDKELIPLKEELKFADDYIFLSKIRYGNGLNVKNNISGNEQLIVPLGLQMLIENAIKHNVISDDKPLDIEMGTDGDSIYVKNNLQRKSSVDNTNRVGLENLVKRYEYLSDIQVQIIESESQFEVRIPLLKTDKDELPDR